MSLGESTVRADQIVAAQTIRIRIKGIHAMRVRLWVARTLIWLARKTGRLSMKIELE